MPYNELIKNFDRIRDYMREFYVYGFKSREEFRQKSARSYDDERRRLESWLGDHMGFRQTADGKNLFLSIDSRVSRHNPLYKAWKARSFTDGSITLHFLLFDVLSDPEVCLSFNEITERIDEYLRQFRAARTFDASTVRKKLKEYADEGLILTEKQGRTVLYRRADSVPIPDGDLLDFFSEAAPCGVIGSFLLDRAGDRGGRFLFKHHYITQTMDSEILCLLFDAMREKRYVLAETVNRRRETISGVRLVPLRVFISVQNGRQYLMAYVGRQNRIRAFRLDNLRSVIPMEPCERFDELRETLDRMQSFLWGASTEGGSERMEYVSFTVTYGDDEGHIHHRLEREKRCGRVERLDAHTSRFSADVYDSSELVPWIRTFLCRITDLDFSNKALEERFRRDIEAMYCMYEIEGGDAP